jgi:hypothetical protein
MEVVEWTVDRPAVLYRVVMYVWRRSDRNSKCRSVPGLETRLGLLALFETSEPVTRLSDVKDIWPPGSIEPRKTSDAVGTKLAARSKSAPLHWCGLTLLTFRLPLLQS